MINKILDKSQLAEDASTSFIKKRKRASLLGMLFVLVLLASCDSGREEIIVISTSNEVISQPGSAFKSKMISGVQAWNSVKTDTLFLEDKFRQGNSVQFTMGKGFLDGSAYLHAYPIITDSSFQLILMSSSHDDSTYLGSTGMDTSFFLTLPVTYNTSYESDQKNKIGYVTDTLSTDTAIKRMKEFENGKEMKKYVVDRQTNQRRKNDMFRALRIPSQGLVEDKEYDGFLALRHKRSSNLNERIVVIDFIIRDVNGNRIVWEDMVRPVPPFDPSSFTLLKMADQQSQ